MQSRQRLVFHRSYNNGPSTQAHTAHSFPHTTFHTQSHTVSPAGPTRVETQGRPRFYAEPPPERIDVANRDCLRSRTEIAYALGQRDGFLLHPLAEQLVRCVEHGARRTRSRWCARSRTRCHLAHAHGARAVLSSEDRHESGGQRHPWFPQPLG